MTSAQKRYEQKRADKAGVSIDEWMARKANKTAQAMPVDKRKIKYNDNRCVVVNGVEFPIYAYIDNDAAAELTRQIVSNKISLEELVVQSLAYHWVTYNEFKKSHAGTLNTLLGIAYDIGYVKFEFHNGKIKATREKLAA